MPSRLLVLLALVLLAGCDSSAPPRRAGTLPVDPGQPPPPSPERVQEAEQAITRIEEDLRQVRTLPPAERRVREREFGKRLEQALDTTVTTKFENKNLYWLAYWRYTYADGDGVEPLLDRLDKLSSPALKTTGTGLRVQLRLRQGRVAEARQIATPLAAQIREFRPLLDLVAFYERVGQPAPHLAGHNLGGGPGDPLAGRKEPWLLYLFIEQFDDNAEFLARSYQQAIADLGPANPVRMVLVTFEGNALAPAQRVRQAFAPDLPDLLWANPNTGGDADEWRTRWQLPWPPPHVALVGADRSIMAVEVSPEMLKKLLSGGK
jgi:hypothetical protein